MGESEGSRVNPCILLHDAILHRMGQARLGNVTCEQHLCVYMHVSSLSAYVST